MEYTENLKLNIPLPDEPYDIEHFNENARIIDGLFSLGLIEEAFQTVFTHLGDTEPIVAEAMTAEDIEQAINTAWNGESSTNPNAMSAADIEEALLAEWNGESSTDPNALSAEDINEAIANATI